MVWRLLLCLSNPVLEAMSQCTYNTMDSSDDNEVIKPSCKLLITLCGGYNLTCTGWVRKLRLRV